jgi:hypothetical protein
VKPGQIGQQRNISMLFKGYSAALLSQVPYTVISISAYEYLNESFFNQDQMIFNKFDDNPFIIKAGLRFGAVTFSLVLA